MIVKKKITPIFKAEQWFKGVKINFVEVIDKGPFVPTGNWSDRFEDRPDVYIKIDDSYPVNTLKVTEGDWVMCDLNNEISVVSDKYFKEHFTQV